MSLEWWRVKWIMNTWPRTIIDVDVEIHQDDVEL